MSAISYVVALLGPALASASMTILIWLPFWIGIALLLLAFRAISKLPSQQTFPASQSTTIGDEDASQPLLASPAQRSTSSQTLIKTIAGRFSALTSVFSDRPRNFSLLLVSFFLTSLASSDTKLLVQYISMRYRWSFASAGYLLSGKAVVNFTLLTIIVPTILRWRAEANSLRDRPEPPDAANLRYARLCLVVSVLGALAIALSGAIWLLVPALLVYALGSALPVFTLSLLKSPLLSPHLSLAGPVNHAAAASAETHIFAIVMLVKTLGSLVGAPLMAGLWIRGITVGGVGFGLPYFVSAVCYTIAIIVFSGMKLEQGYRKRSQGSPS
jgi:hypothetical protein